jgi:hypothetical protein
MLGMIASFLTRNDAAQNPGRVQLHDASWRTSTGPHLPISPIA